MGIQHTSLPVGELIAKINKGEIRLPEIQRAYVWKAGQIAKLVDSIYRGYPSGSLLMWQDDLAPVSRILDVGHADTKSLIAPWYLLDGQQRLTSLYRFMTGHADAQVVFHLEQEKFQIQSAATKKDPKFVLVHDILETTSTFSLIKELDEKGLALTADEIDARITRLKGIANHMYEIDVLADFTYVEVTEVFHRVNSGGRPLKTSDLLLSTLSARWPGAMGKLTAKADELAAKSFPDLDLSWLVKALAGAVLKQGLSHSSYGAITAASDDALTAGWATVLRGVDDLLPLLTGNLGVSSSRILPSVNVLIPAAVYLGERPNEPLAPEHRDALLWWILVATVQSRYSSSADTRLSQDIPAALAGDGLRTLVGGLGLLGPDFSVTAKELAGKTVGSPFFFLSYLVAQRLKAKDWWFGTPVDVSATGAKAVQFHHIHPQATLKGTYAKDQVNDLANLAFISAKANLKISDRSPAAYFPELGPEAFAGHSLPLETDLRVATAYPAFAAARRQLLADEMTALLQQFQPDWLGEAIAAPAPEASAPSLNLDAYLDDAGSGRLVAMATVDGQSWTGSVDFGELAEALVEASTNLVGQATISGIEQSVEMVDDVIEVAFGPIFAFGTLEEWQTVLERERAEARPLAEVPDLGDSPATDATERLAVVESS